MHRSTFPCQTSLWLAEFKTVWPASTRTMESAGGACVRADGKNRPSLFTVEPPLDKMRRDSIRAAIDKGWKKRGCKRRNVWLVTGSGGGRFVSWMMFRASLHETGNNAFFSFFLLSLFLSLFFFFQKERTNVGDKAIFRLRIKFD